MKVTQVAIRYARSLFDLALEQKQLDPVYADVRTMSRICRDSKEIRLLLQSPIVSSEKKEKILKEVFGAQVTPLTLRFILLLTRKRREAYLPPIAESFIEQYLAYRNILPVQVKASAPLTQDTRTRIAEVMKKYTGSEIELAEETDPALIGGFCLSWKDMQYDATLRHAIERLKREIGNVNLYAKDL